MSAKEFCIAMFLLYTAISSIKTVFALKHGETTAFYGIIAGIILPATGTLLYLLLISPFNKYYHATTYKDAIYAGSIFCIIWYLQRFYIGGRAKKKD